MSETTTVKVSQKYQIAIPSYARKLLTIAAGDRLLVDVQDGLLVLTPEPADYVVELAGLHRVVWQDVDTAVYLNEERSTWTPSPTGSPGTN